MQVSLDTTIGVLADLTVLHRRRGVIEIDSSSPIVAISRAADEGMVHQGGIIAGIAKEDPVPVTGTTDTGPIPICVASILIILVGGQNNPRGCTALYQQFAIHCKPGV